MSNESKNGPNKSNVIKLFGKGSQGDPVRPKTPSESRKIMAEANQRRADEARDRRANDEKEWKAGAKASQFLKDNYAQILLEMRGIQGRPGATLRLVSADKERALSILAGIFNASQSSTIRDILFAKLVSWLEREYPKGPTGQPILIRGRRGIEVKIIWEEM